LAEHGQNVPNRLTDQESATILHALLKRHASLMAEAEKLATKLMKTSSSLDIAASVVEAVTSLDLQDLNGRAGATPGGYVEPTDAAWELLEEAVEDFLADMRRRAELGLTDAADMMCRGIIAGLYRAKDKDSDGPLGWAPDFPAEEACHAVAELLRACPGQTRTAVRTRILDALAADVPDWAAMLNRTATKAP